MSMEDSDTPTNDRVGSTGASTEPRLVSRSERDLNIGAETDPPGDQRQDDESEASTEDESVPHAPALDSTESEPSSFRDEPPPPPPPPAPPVPDPPTLLGSYGGVFATRRSSYTHERRSGGPLGPLWTIKCAIMGCDC
mmetsp:Transcript_8044/g.22212  ORF Transcript_8044/g.22212 Transcript_8044/m.22212 type:complete len:138 (-) Transcript_8044:93-506(-)